MRPLPTVSFRLNVQCSSKTTTWRIANRRQPTCFITREANTLRHTQVRTKCTMVATSIEVPLLPPKPAAVDIATTPRPPKSVLLETYRSRFNTGN